MDKGLIPCHDRSSIIWQANRQKAISDISDELSSSIFFPRDHARSDANRRGLWIFDISQKDDCHRRSYGWAILWRGKFQFLIEFSMCFRVFACLNITFSIFTFANCSFWIHRRNSKCEMWTTKSETSSEPITANYRTRGQITQKLRYKCSMSLIATSVKSCGDCLTILLGFWVRNAKLGFTLRTLLHRYSLFSVQIIVNLWV